MPTSRATRTPQETDSFGPSFIEVFSGWLCGAGNFSPVPGNSTRGGGCRESDGFFELEFLDAIALILIAIDAEERCSVRRPVRLSGWTRSTAMGDVSRCPTWSSCYSARSATIGSTRAARRAGPAAASQRRASTARGRGEADRIESPDPEEERRISCASIAAAAAPMATPTAVSASPWRRTRRRTDARRRRAPCGSRSRARVARRCTR